MFALTGQPLLTSTAILAVILPVVAVVLWSRRRGLTRRGGGPAVARTSLSVLGRAVLVVAAQGLAVMVAFLMLNNQYSFYTSWSDLLGTSTQNAQVQDNMGSGSTTAANASVPVSDLGAGKLSSLTIPDPVAKVTHQTLVWTPPEYRQARYAHTKFPVLMFLPGQPSTPSVVFQHYNFGSIAGRAIASGQVHPFVAVFPPLMTNPPRDTECTNVPGGPQALTWLTHSVPQALVKQYRVVAPGPQWSVMGWSTGGFCAAKLALGHPGLFGAAASFGGYFEPLTDSTTGNLFHGNVALKQANSPLALYRRYGMRGERLLIIAGRQDSGSWSTAAPMIQATRGAKGVSYIAFPVGGHNYRNYRAYLAPALMWIERPA